MLINLMIDVNQFTRFSIKLWKLIMSVNFM